MIHQYKNNGYNIVLDVNSGSVHVMDDLCYDVTEVLDRQYGELVSESLSSPEISGILERELGSTYKKEELEEALLEIAGSCLRRMPLPVWFRW